MDSKTIFGLRKESQSLFGVEKLNKLTVALNMARDLYSQDPYNEWSQKAFAYILFDLCKFYIEQGNLNQAHIYFNEVNSINFYGKEDDIIAIQKKNLQLKIDSTYSEVKKATELSKTGHHQKALAIFKELISQNKLTQLHHEAYGWMIYRLIKTEENNLSSVEVRTFLRDYIRLENERPSLLHSMILNFALNYSKTHIDFNFYNFFLHWNPKYLRSDDMQNGVKEGKEIPSLISRICKEFIKAKTIINIEELLQKISLNKEIILDFFREQFFWDMYNAHKQKKLSELWSLFEQYNLEYSRYGQSQWHSKILNLAERFMKDNEEWRFLNFFENWNPENLRTEDWKETITEGKAYKPLAIKAIKKAFDNLKSLDTVQSYSWLILLYEEALKLFPNDQWILREKALLHFKNNELDFASLLYKQLALKLSDQYYVWQEFATCIVSNNSLKIGMLSKALNLEKNEDYLGGIHLELATLLIEENLLENALVELEMYKKNRDIKGWKLSPDFENLLQKTNSAKQGLENNHKLYKEYIPYAENFAYADLEWTETVLVADGKDTKGRNRLTFSDGKNIEFTINKSRFEILKNLELGQALKFKLHKQEIEIDTDFTSIDKVKTTKDRYIPLLAKKSEKNHWGVLEDTFAYIEYINQEKNIIHAITCENKEIFFPQIKLNLEVGDFVSAKKYTSIKRDVNMIQLVNIKKLDKYSALTKFQSQIAIVDGVNDDKKLFHFVISSSLQGIIKFTETNLKIKEGDFIKVAFVTKIGKDKKTKVKIINIELSDEINSNLRKDITGYLELKYKDHNYVKEQPDFAFIDNYYVSKQLLKKYNIIDDCMVDARAVFSGEKWKVIDIQKLDTVSINEV